MKQNQYLFQGQCCAFPSKLHTHRKFIHLLPYHLLWAWVLISPWLERRNRQVNSVTPLPGEPTNGPPSRTDATTSMAPEDRLVDHGSNEQNRRPQTWSTYQGAQVSGCHDSQPYIQ